MGPGLVPPNVGKIHIECDKESSRIADSLPQDRIAPSRLGRPLAGLVCLILQVTLIGWLPAAIWAVYALSQYKTDQKIEQALRQSNGG